MALNKGVVWKQLLLLLVVVVQRSIECIRIDPQGDGGDAREGQFPFMVQLQRWWVVSFLHECGGSLLTPSWILTAAHCNEYHPKLQALAGTIRLNDRTGGQRRAVVRFLPHEAYVLDGRTGPYDVALAQVEHPFLVDGHSVATVELGVRPEAGSSRPTFLLGFGKIDEADTMPEVLRFIRTHFRPASECRRGKGIAPLVLGTVCVGSPGSAACQGDSGGPLVSWDEAGKPRVVGVISYGSPSCGAKPITCTDVAAYGEWIEGTLSEAEQRRKHHPLL